MAGRVFGRAKTRRAWLCAIQYRTVARTGVASNSALRTTPLLIARCTLMAGRIVAARPRSAYFWLAVFVLLQMGRLWVIASLGRRWTTCVIVRRGTARVALGPYRWLKHPNYLIVALEIAVVPLALGLPVFALVFSIANAALLVYRIRIENEALAWAAQGA